MRILDSYVLNRFLRQLLWAILAAALVFLTVDVVEHLDKFIDSGVPTGTVMRYYLLFIPYIVYLILPVAMLLATLFTIGGMTLSNELSAMQTSGVPFTRPLALLLATAAAAALLSFAVGETLVPVANRRRMDIYRYEVKKMPRESRARGGKLYLQISPGRHLYIERYDPKTREAYGIEVFDVDAGLLAARYDAYKMVWRDNCWWLQGAVLQEFAPDGSVRVKREVPLHLSGAGLRPDEFERVQTAPEEMNWAELREFIARLRMTGGTTLRWEIDLLFKVSLPVATVIIVLFGAPIAAVKRRGGTALGFGLSLFVCFIYFGFLQVGKVLGYNGSLPPLLSAWVGNIFFGLLGSWILVRTAR